MTSGTGLEQGGLLLLLLEETGQLLRTAGGGAGGAAGDIDLAAFRANGGVEGDRLADHLPVFPHSGGLLPDHMLLLMAPNGGSRLLRGDVGGGLEGDAGVVRLVLILPFLTGLALGFLHDLLGGFGLLELLGRLVLPLGRLELGGLRLLQAVLDAAPRTAISTGSAPSRWTGSWLSEGTGWVTPRWTGAVLATGWTGVVWAAATGVTAWVLPGAPRRWRAVVVLP